MGRPTKKDINGLITYIKSLDIERLKKTKDRQHDLVVMTFESQQATLNEDTKQILLDDAYLSWLLFLRFDLDKSLGEAVDYKLFLENLSCLRKLWYSARAHEHYKKTGEAVLAITVEEIDREFSSILFKPSQLIPENSILLSSMVIALDYEKVLNTLARQDL